MLIQMQKSRELSQCATRSMTGTHVMKKYKLHHYLKSKTMVSGIFRNLNLAVHSTVVILVVILASVIVQWLYFIKLPDPEVLSSHKTTLEKKYFQEASLSPVKKFVVMGELATFVLESCNNQLAFNRPSIKKRNFSLVHVIFCHCSLNPYELVSVSAAGGKDLTAPGSL